MYRRSGIHKGLHSISGHGWLSMQDIPTYLLTQGVLGLVALVEGFVITRLYNEIKDLRKEKDTLQEARRLDAVETRNQVTSVLPGLSQGIQNLTDKIEISKSRSR